MSQQVSTPEVLRLQYLQAMGITSYYPRLQLPGALPSQVCSWPFAENPGGAPTRPGSVLAEPAAAVSSDTDPGSAAPATQPITATSAASAPARRSTWQLEPTAKTGAALAVAATENSGLAVRLTEAATELKGAQQAAEAVHLQLLLMQVDDALAVVLQVPAMGKPYLQDQQGQLLINLLRWLGEPPPAMIAPRVFRWPLPGLSLTNNRREAGASLLHFLEQAYVERAFRHVLMLGEQAADCLRSKGELATPWQLSATHNLDEMLALPPLKREVWQSLLPLHAALARERSIKP